MCSSTEAEASRSQLPQRRSTSAHVNTSLLPEPESAPEALKVPVSGGAIQQMKSAPGGISSSPWLYIQSGALQGVTVHLGPESVHCDDSWVVVDCPGLTLSYIGLVPF
jgi:hypothetical protein